MTLKELLLNTHFDDVAACIKELYSDQESMILDYKEVFDRLRVTEAIPSDRKIRICMSEPFFDDILGEEMRVLIVMCDFKSDIKQKRLVQ